MGYRMLFLVAVTVLLLSRLSHGEKDISFVKTIETYLGKMKDAICENSKISLPSLDEPELSKSSRKEIESSPHTKHRPRNCEDLFDGGDKQSGVRTVYPYSCSENLPVSVYCDQTSDGGGWTVFQHRENLPQREDFFRKWTEYKLGFGNLTGEFWLGLENIRALVKDKLMELKVDLENYEGEKRWAKYDYFYIGDASEKYRLELGKYSGDAGNSLEYQDGQLFSTKDQDNDIKESQHCSQVYKGAWWYKDCHASNLNGYQYVGRHTSYADGINWSDFSGQHYSLKKTSLSLRSKFRS